MSLTINHRVEFSKKLISECLENPKIGNTLMTLTKKIIENPNQTIGSNERSIMQKKITFYSEKDLSYSNQRDCKVRLINKQV